MTLGVNLLSHEGNGQTGHRMLINDEIVSLAVMTQQNINSESRWCGRDRVGGRVLITFTLDTSPDPWTTLSLDR